MLWNWTTIGACFLSKDWHIKNSSMFAATCIGVLLLTMLLEFLRRLGKEYDEFLVRQFQRRAETAAPVLTARGCAGGTEFLHSHVVTFRASLVQQAIRALIHGVTFGGAYITMLLAMYFNGYIIVCIFLGAGLGKFLCDWLVVKIDIGKLQQAKSEEQDEPGTCCGGTKLC